MGNRANELHHQTIVVDGHNSIMMELVKRRNRGDRAVFSNYYGPMIREAGVKVIMLIVGGDNTCLTNDSDLMLWGSLWVVDMLWEEEEESSDTISICLTCKDIDAALAEGKIAILMTMEGGRPLEGKPNLETLVGLRTFYRLGVREVQLVDNGRNRIGDGKGEFRTRGGLTNFGISLVKEMNRLGMIIDVAHLTEPGFWDVIETSKDPITDSHSNCRAVCDHIRNITDEQIKAIAKGGGVIGLNCYKAFVSGDNKKPTVDDLMKHVDHIVELVGIDYVGLAPDTFDYEIPVNIWTPAPGWLEGVFYGIQDSYHVEGLGNIKGFPLFTDALIKRGYSDEDIKKILGGNWLRLYRRVIG
jgi:membrane dipeptidase